MSAVRDRARLAGFLARRVQAALLTVFGAMLLLFLLIKFVPGDFASVLLGPRATPELRAQITQQMGLDKSLIEQIWLFVSHAAVGDFGEDVISRRPILTMVLEVLPNTLALAVCALGLSLLLGIPLGLLAALRPGSIADSVLGILSVAFITTPSFVVSICLLLVFSLALNWLPVSGVGDPGDPLDKLAHLVLPTVALAIGWVGYISRIVRASLVETLGELHVRTLRAYGVSEIRIAGIYALRLALVPLVAVLGIGLGDLIGSAVFAEIIFARPGLGSLIYNAILNRNYPVVQASALLIVILYVLANLVVDAINGLLDPRVLRGTRDDAAS